jgi:hypothetical protein
MEEINNGTALLIGSILSTSEDRSGREVEILSWTSW